VESISPKAKLRAWLVSLMEDDMMAGAAAPADVPSDASGEDQVWAAFRQAIMAAVDDDSMDIPATLKRIKQILTSYDKLSGGGGSDAGAGGATDSGAGGGGGGATMESVMEELRQLRNKDAARDLLESAGVDVSPVRVKALAALGSDKDRQELVESWKGAEPSRTGGRFGNGGKAPRPERSAPLLESLGNDQGPMKYPNDTKGFAAALK
jgi:hypothetical protein